MKRFRQGEGEMDSINIAGVLMLLSRGADEESGTRSSAVRSPSRVFECKTCNRQFPSFQALGGHRASHKKPRAVADAGRGHAKRRVHECSVCGLEFAIGQALGGHMRRHRAEGGGEKKKVWLDLNMPPTLSVEDEMECRRMGFGLEIVEPIPMVDCFY